MLILLLLLLLLFLHWYSDGKNVMSVGVNVSLKEKKILAYVEHVVITKNQQSHRFEMQHEHVVHEPMVNMTIEISHIVVIN